MRDEDGRYRVRTKDFDPLYGWATSAPASSVEPSGGYTVEWDDGWVDRPETRWFFDSGDFLELEAV